MAQALLFVVVNVIQNARNQKLQNIHMGPNTNFYCFRIIFLKKKKLNSITTTNCKILSDLNHEMGKVNTEYIVEIGIYLLIYS